MRKALLIAGICISTALWLYMANYTLFCWWVAGCDPTADKRSWEQRLLGSLVAVALITIVETYLIRKLIKKSADSSGK